MPPKTDDPAATLPPIVTLDNRPHAVYPMRGGGNIHVRVTTHLCRFWRERRGIGQATIDYELRDYDDTIAHFLAGAVSAMLASRTTLQGNASAPRGTTMNTTTSELSQRLAPYRAILHRATATADEKRTAWQKIVDIQNEAARARGVIVEEVTRRWKDTKPVEFQY